MMMKLIFWLSILIIFITLGFYLISLNKNFIYKKRNYITIKGSSKGLYKYEIPFQKGTKAIEAIYSLLYINKEIKNIFIWKNKKKIKVKFEYKIFEDSLLKVEYK